MGEVERTEGAIEEPRAARIGSTRRKNKKGAREKENPPRNTNAYA